MSQSVEELPCRVKVKELVESRYGGGSSSRPADWSERLGGVDRVRTECGKELSLLSDGQQSPPESGWVLLLTGGDNQSGYTWTLYGLPAAA